MIATSKQTFRIGALLLLGLSLATGLISSRVIALAAADPVPVQGMVTALPAETCTFNAGTNTRTCELWAKTGTIALPGGISLPAWGYADSAAGAAQIPGPALIANQGETLEVILHNDLAETTGLYFHGVEMLPDLTGVAAGGTATYTLQNIQPGTFLYEAAPLTGAQHQVALGMAGALVVRPAGVPGQAFADAATAFDDEALVILSEIDPALNNSANPAAFDLRSFAPKYWLINGRAYPDTEMVTTAAGHRVLLRYINAGLEHHSMAVLGLRQVVLSLDGIPLGHSTRLVADTLAPGQTADALVTVPASAVPGSRFALYDGSLLLHNNGSASLGGMLTFLEYPDGAGGGDDTTGPAAAAVALSPDPTDGSVDVTLIASISDVSSGGSNIQAAEYFVDSSGVDGSGIVMQAADGSFDSPVEPVTATLPTAFLGILTAGDHTLYVHGQDANGNWGTFNFVVLHLDKAGPATTSLALAPNPSGGSVSVALSGTADDSANGNSNIAGAEYFIGTAGADGTGTAMTINITAPIASLGATISAADLAGLPEGTHTIHVHSQDAFGQWGAFATIDLKIDQTGPAASDLVAAPNPNNGAMPISPTQPSVRLDARISDPINLGVQSNIKTAEGFIDTVGADGTGFPMTPRDGLFNSPAEDAYAFIPLTTINTLSEGPHQLFVHGQDASGNWGAAVSVTLLIDKSGPTVSSVSASPNPTNGAASITLTASATDTVTNIAAAEWYKGADPGAGNGQAMAATDGSFDALTEGLTAAIDVSGFAAGSHTLYVRARDAAGNWSAAVSVVVTVVPPDLIFADSFASGSFSAWSSFTGAGISVAPTAALDGDGFGMQASITGGAGGYVTDTRPVQEPAYHAQFLFNPNGARPGNNTPHAIFAGQDGANTTIFRLQYRRQNQAGGTYQIRAGVLTAGGEVFTSWHTITDGTANRLEIAWASGTSATFDLHINGVVVQSLTNLNTSAYRLETILLGPSQGLTGAMTGVEYFDAFVSKRYTVIGP